MSDSAPQPEAPARVCRQCGAKPSGPDDLKCPDDGSWFVDEKGLVRYKLDPLLGTALDGKYPLLKVLGEGGFGTVYLAKQLAEGKVLREVAVKTVRATGAVDSEEATGRFRREAAAIARLNHPNVVQLYDFGVTEDGIFFMVLELVNGLTLGDIFSGRELFTPERVTRVFRQVLEGLAAAHDAGMVHRDLKPDNIMLVNTKWAKDQVKILDFGLAKLMGGDDAMKLSQTNTAYGTVHYMAPEQVVGSKVDARSDLYPIGVMLYQIYAGFRPFDAESAPIVMFQHVHRDVPELPESVPIGVRSFIYKALRKRPSERYDSAIDMLQSLEHAMAHPEQEIPGGERPLGIPRPGAGGPDPEDDDPYSAALAADPPGKEGSTPLVTPGGLVSARPQFEAVASAIPPPRAMESRAPSDSAAIAAEMVSADLSPPKPPVWRKAVLVAAGIGVALGLIAVAILAPKGDGGVTVVKGGPETAPGTSPAAQPPAAPAAQPAVAPAAASPTAKEAAAQLPAGDQATKEVVKAPPAVEGPPAAGDAAAPAAGSAGGAEVVAAKTEPTPARKPKKKRKRKSRRKAKKAAKAEPAVDIPRL